MRIILIILLAVSIIPTFAQSLITFDVDTTKFTAGEIVELKGKVTGGLEGQPVAVEIKDADGNVMLIRTVTSDENGDFVLKFKVPNNVKTGEFDIVTSVELDGQSFSEIKAVESVASTSEPVPDPEPTPEPQPTCGKGTELVDGICQVIKTEEKSKGGGCLIATATYGSELAPQVQRLRELRDNSLLQTASGTSFMNIFNDFYYSFSPTIADWERESPAFKEFVKITLTPMISSLSILNYVDMDSEVSVLGYGISLILLNVGMYFVAPSIIIIGIRKNWESKTRKKIHVVSQRIKNGGKKIPKRGHCVGTP